jgi:hypothetical protein
LHSLVSGATNSTARYNLLYNNGIGISQSTQYATGNTFYNNVMDGNGYAALRGDYYGHVGAAASTWKNNIFSNSPIYGLVNDQYTDPPSESHNLWYNNPTNIYRVGTGEIAINAKDKTANPLFISQTDRDYRPLITSPAINAGVFVTEVHDQSECLDYADNPCVSDGVPDIGAYEYQSDTIIGDGSGGSGGGGCFIANAAYASYSHSDIIFSRYFRDRYLPTNEIGKIFETKPNLSYQLSPMTNVIGQNIILQATTRMMLAPIVYGIKYLNIFVLLLLVCIISVISRWEKIKIMKNTITYYNYGLKKHGDNP